MGKKPKQKKKPGRKKRGPPLTSHYGEPFESSDAECLKCGRSTWRYCKKFFREDGRDKVAYSCACLKCGCETEFFPSPTDMETYQKKMEEAQKNDKRLLDVLEEGSHAE